jgi:hypothetical protein
LTDPLPVKKFFMFRPSGVFIITSLTLVMVGCNNAEQSATQTSLTASPASETAATPTTKDGFQNLLTVVSNTKVAVQKSDFTNAKQEFNKFEDSWKKVEDGVKVKSPDGYKAIEENLDEVTAELKGSKPNKQKVVAGLESLNKNITSVAKP